MTGIFDTNKIHTSKHTRGSKMKHIKANEFTSEFEFKAAQKQQRKADRQKRDARNGKRSLWNAENN